MISDHPARAAIRDHFTKKFANELHGHSFNAIQSNLYSGPPHHQETLTNTYSEGLDHCGWHKDGTCKKRGPPIISGCYSNLTAQEIEEGRMYAAFLIQREKPPFVQVWIPHTQGTAYAFGGNECHTKYYHAKYLFGFWPCTRYHISFTLSCYEPFRLTSSVEPPHGLDVKMDWQAPGLSKPWWRRYISGMVPKGTCSEHISTLNGSAILQNALSNTKHHAFWQPWDQFSNASVLQLLHLHPASKGNGVGGKGFAVSILIRQGGKGSKFPNRIEVHKDRHLLRVHYYVAEQGFTLLQQSMMESLLIRAFLCPTHEGRQLFSGNQKAILFLPLLHIVEMKKEQQGGLSCILESRLSKYDVCMIK